MGIVPIHKYGEDHDVKNYQGVTSLLATSKLFEMIMSGVVLEQVKCYISSDEHGFMPNVL